MTWTPVYVLKVKVPPNLPPEQWDSYQRQWNLIGPCTIKVVLIGQGQSGLQISVMVLLLKRYSTVELCSVVQ